MHRQYQSFYIWVSSLFLHTGNYGSGDTGILKWNEFTDHLKWQFDNTRLLTWVVLMLLLVMLMYLSKNRKTGILKDIIVRPGFTLVLVVGLEYLFAAKHFAFHYMIPSILLTVFCVLLILMLVGDHFPWLMNSMVKNGVFIAVGFFMLFSITPKVISQVKQIKQIVETKKTSFARIKPLLKATPKIICASYYVVPPLNML